jgi:hypothetical protein
MPPPNFSDSSRRRTRISSDSKVNRDRVSASSPGPQTRRISVSSNRELQAKILVEVCVDVLCRIEKALKDYSAISGGPETAIIGSIIDIVVKEERQEASTGGDVAIVLSLKTTISNLRSYLTG